MNDQQQVLLTIAKMALDAATLTVNPILPPPHASIAPQPKPKRVTGTIAPTAATAGEPKRTGFAKGSKFYLCADCKRGFASADDPMDVTCKHCNSIHVQPRTRTTS